MVKFESVVKNVEDSINNNGVFFLLENNKINCVYSSSDKQLVDTFNIITGFFKPNIGGIIYDNYDINQFNLSDKAYFIRENISIVTPFNSLDNNITVFDFLYFHCLILGFNKKESLHKIDVVLKNFGLDFFRTSKISDLSNNIMINLLIANTKLKNTKYLFFYDVSQYIATVESYSYFLETLLNHYNLNETVVAFFVNQKPSIIELNKNNKQKINYNIIDLDNNELENKELIIRNKKLVDHKNYSSNFLKIFVNVFRQNYFSHIISVIFYLLTAIMLVFSLYALYENKLNKTVITTLVVITSLFNLLYSFWFSYLTYKNIKWKMFLVTRYGLNLVECLWLMLFYILFVNVCYFVLGFSFLLVFRYVLNISINWVMSFALLFFVSLISILTLVITFAFDNQKIVKKYSQFN